MPPQRPDPPPALHPVTLATLLALLLATALRTVGLAAPSVWFDEAWTAHAAGQATLAGAWLADGTNPPLGYVVAWIAARGLGIGEFALRLPAALLGVVVVALAARVAGRAFGRRAAILAALLVAASPLQVWAGREARMYTLLAVCGLGAVAAWLAVARGERGVDTSDEKQGVAVRRPWRPRAPSRAYRAWLLLVAAELGALYSHNTGPIVVLALNALTLAAWAASRRLARPDWRAWVLSQAVVVAVWAPEWAARFNRLGGANDAIAARPALDGATLRALWDAHWIVPWGRAAAAGEPWLLGAALMAVLVAIPWRRPAARALAAYAALLSVGVVAGLIVLRNELHARYLVMAGPPLLIAVAGGLAGGGPTERRAAAGSAASTAVRVVAAVVVATASFVGLRRAFATPDWHEDARAMARHEAATLGPADTIVAMSYADRYDLAYYADREGVAARRLTLPEGADVAAVWPRLPRAGRVALAMRYGSPADRRGMLPCLLGARAVGPPERYTTAGLSELLYELDDTLDRDGARASWSPLDAMRPVDPIVFGDAGADGAAAVSVAAGEASAANGVGAAGDSSAAGGVGATGDAASASGRLTAVGAPERWPADRAICVALRFVVDRPPAAGELKAAVIARDALGAEIAHADAVLATADERGAADVPAGTALDGFALLRLPVGSPPGDVPLWVRIYDPAAASEGLAPRLAGTDGEAARRVAGTSVLVGQVTATVGAWDDVVGAGGGDVGTLGDDIGAPIDLPRRLDVATAAGPRLVATDAPTATVDAAPLANGAATRVTLLWRGGGPLPALVLADADGRWSADVPPPADWDAPLRRDVRVLAAPPEAPSGTAELRLADGAVVGRWRVASEPLVTTAPPLAASTGAAFPGVGALLGVVAIGDGAEGGAPSGGGDGSPARILARATPGPPLTVTLAWRAGGGEAVGGAAVGGAVMDNAAAQAERLAPRPDLTIFVQLLDATGRVVAQSDARPAGGARPTTGWRRGEVIVDVHRLEWHEGAVTGPLTLIAGLYDAASGARARTAGGADAVVVAVGAGP